MLTRKNIIQKAFRLDDRIVNSLDILSEVTGRSQNELASLAFRDLFIKNALYFIEQNLCKRIKETSYFTCNIAGLIFAYKNNMLAVYTKNPNEPEYVLSSYDYGHDNDLMFKEFEGETQRKEEIGYHLCRIENISKDPDTIYEDIHEAIFCINTNFVEFQEWVQKNFNFD